MTRHDSSEKSEPFVLFDDIVNLTLLDTVGAAACQEPKCVTEKPVALPELSQGSSGRIDLSPNTNSSGKMYLSVGEVAQRFSVGKSTIWRWVNENPFFPAPYSISEGTTRWKASGIEAFEASRPRCAKRKSKVAAGGKRR